MQTIKFFQRDFDGPSSSSSCQERENDTDCAGVLPDNGALAPNAAVRRECKDEVTREIDLSRQANLSTRSRDVSQLALHDWFAVAAINHAVAFNFSALRPSLLSCQAILSFALPAEPFQQ